MWAQDVALQIKRKYRRKRKVTGVTVKLSEDFQMVFSKDKRFGGIIFGQTGSGKTHTMCIILDNLNVPAIFIDPKGMAWEIVNRIHPQRQWQFYSTSAFSSDFKHFRLPLSVIPIQAVSRLVTPRQVPILENIWANEIHKKLSFKDFRELLEKNRMHNLANVLSTVVDRHAASIEPEDWFRSLFEEADILYFDASYLMGENDPTLEVLGMTFYYVAQQVSGPKKRFPVCFAVDELHEFLGGSSRKTASSMFRLARVIFRMGRQAGISGLFASQRLLDFPTQFLDQADFYIIQKGRLITRDHHKDVLIHLFGFMDGFEAENWARKVMELDRGQVYVHYKGHLHGPLYVSATSGIKTVIHTEEEEEYDEEPEYFLFDEEYPEGVWVP